MYRVIGADGREYGPVSAEEARQWLLQGRLNFQSLVRGPGDSAWRPYATFPELAPPLSATGADATSAPPAANPMARWGFILALVSVVCSCCCCCGSPLNLVALVFCIVGFSQAQSQGDQHSRSLALAGLVLALFSFVAGIISGLVAAVAQMFAHLAR